MNPQTPQDRLDQATSDRLAKLRSMPVDLSRLDKMILAQIPKPQSRQNWIIQHIPLRAVAASIATIAMIGVIVWSLSGGAVLAAPDAMARLHTDLVSGKYGTPVTSIEEAGQKLSVDMPQLPSEHAMLCCMHSIQDKRVACVLLKSDNDSLVTMVVGKASDMRMPHDPSKMLTRNGNQYHVQSANDLNMVMVQRDGRWICLIGALPAERLIDIAGSIKL